MGAFFAGCSSGGSHMTFWGCLRDHSADGADTQEDGAMARWLRGSRVMGAQYEVAMSAGAVCDGDHRLKFLNKVCVAE